MNNEDRVGLVNRPRIGDCARSERTNHHEPANRALGVDTSPERRLTAATASRGTPRGGTSASAVAGVLLALAALVAIVVLLGGLVAGVLLALATTIEIVVALGGLVAGDVGVGQVRVVRV